MDGNSLITKIILILIRHEILVKRWTSRQNAAWKPTKYEAK